VKNPETPATGRIVVFCTCSSYEEAARIARHLVETRVAACVNIVPGLTSVYRWQGAIEEAAEVLLIIKSSRALFEELRDAIAGLHSYQTPEVIALDIAAGSKNYLEWMTAELKADAIS
jgi:periplasmic divalent cation tolerance protein